MTLQTFEKAIKALPKTYETQPKSLALQLCLANLQQLKGLQGCYAYSSAEELPATGQPWQTTSARAGHKFRGKMDQLLSPLGLRGDGKNQKLREEIKAELQ